jgi:lipopolysaccharide cholinephosphotransferase
MSECIQNNLRPIWDAILEVYKVFAAICDRHGLCYCADCGTALGAVRHGGFIPWDDDMDIQMPRPDYEKFVEIAKRELPEGYAWLDRFNCPEYDNPFGKVIVTDRDVVARVSRESGLSIGQGIFVDVFPLDGFPDTRVGVLRRRLQNILMEMGLKMSDEGTCQTLKAKIIRVLAKLICPRKFRVSSHKEQCDLYEKRAKAIPFGSTSMCVSIGLAHYYDDKPFPFRFFGVPRRIPFEDTMMPVQEDVKGYLTCIFGDFMQLPPEDKRSGTHGNTRMASWRFGPPKDMNRE